MSEYISAPYPNTYTYRRVSPAARTTTMPTTPATLPPYDQDSMRSNDGSGVYVAQAGREHNKRVPRWMWILLFVLLGVLLVAFMRMFMPKHKKRRNLTDESEQGARLAQQRRLQPPTSSPGVLSQESITSDAAVAAVVPRTESSSGDTRSFSRNRKRIDRPGPPGRIYHTDWDGVLENTQKADTAFMLMVHADWCGACKRAMPAYVQAAERSDKTVFLAIEESLIPDDASTRFEWMANIRGYPTFLYFKQRSSDPPVVYSGPRTPEAFLSYVEPR